MAALQCSMTKSFAGTALQARAPTARPAVAVMPVRAAQSLQGKVVSTSQNKTAVVEASGRRSPADAAESMKCRFCHMWSKNARRKATQGPAGSAAPAARPAPHLARCPAAL